LRYWPAIVVFGSLQTNARSRLWQIHRAWLRSLWEFIAQSPRHRDRRLEEKNIYILWHYFLVICWNRLSAESETRGFE
jgi:hypothetical protein